MADKTWKRRERQFAAVFGSTRTGPTGRDDNDWRHPYLAPELKARKKLPKWALDCLEQARTGRTAGGKLPVFFMIGEGMRYYDGLAVMRVKDFLDIVGRVCQNAADQNGAL